MPPPKTAWRITLDLPSFSPFLKYSQRRDLREQVYRGYISRASSGEWNNFPLIERILELKKQKANILGFNSFAELSLKSKMAPNVEAVEALLEELRLVSYQATQQEFQDLKAFARSKGATEAENLQHWDIGFWSERQREEKFAFTDEELRHLFSLPQVLDGLFGLVQRIFGITIIPADGQAPIWHPEVRYFQVANSSGNQSHFSI